MLGILCPGGQRYRHRQIRWAHQKSQWPRWGEEDVNVSLNITFYLMAILGKQLHVGQISF